MSLTPMMTGQENQMDEEIRQSIIEIREKLPELGYSLGTVYKEAREGKIFCAFYELPSTDCLASLAIAYLRVSSELQSDNNSLVTQATHILKLARERDITIARFYLDAGRTGADSKRPAFNAAMRAATNGSFQALYAYDLYRFYRGMRGLTNNYHTLQEHHVDLVSVAAKNTDLGSSDGKLLVYLKGITGELYLDDLSRTITDNKLKRAREGYSNASIAPFGYCRGDCFQCTDNQGEGYCPRFGSRQDLWRELGDDPKVFVPHPIDQHAFRLAAELHKTGNFSDRDIAQRLSRPLPEEMEQLDLARYTLIERIENHRSIVLLEDGTFAIQHPDGDLQFFRPQGRPGCDDPTRRFSKDSIRDILQNPFYAGFVTYRKTLKEKGSRVRTHKRFKSPLSEMSRRERKDARVEGDHGMLFPGCHIPLIDVETFNQCQRVRGLRGCNASNASQTRRVYPLSGVLRCKRCSETFRGNAGNGDVRYYEDSGVATGRSQCPRRMFRAGPIEEAVFARMNQIHIPESWIAGILPYLRKDESCSDLRRERRSLKSRISSAREMTKEDLMSPSEFRQVKQRCERRLERLEREMHADDDRYADLLRDFPRLWQAATTKERKGLIRCVFSTIWLEDGEITGYDVRAPFEELVPAL